MEDKIIFYDNNDLLTCPVCGRETDSLKRYKLKGFGFWLFFFTIYEHDVVACPECMRKAIVHIMKKYILKANLMYINVLIFAFIHYCMSKTKGHSPRLPAELFTLDEEN